MSKTNAFETDFSKLIFTDVALTGIGDATGLRSDAVSAGTLQIALYPNGAEPTESNPGVEITTEQYAGYARVEVARSAVGWTVSGNNTSNAAAIQFPNCTGGTGVVATAVGIHAGGGVQLLYYGILDSNLSISTGVQPQFAIGDLDINED